MKTLYLECNMGAAGDMLVAALLELHENPQDFLKRLNCIGIPGVDVTAERSAKCGITGTHVAVNISTHHHDHHHNDYHGVEHLIGHLKISDSVKKKVLDVYKIIADAESHVHGVPVSQIHFHEVGEMDAIADITGVCMLMEELAPELVLASPVNTGSGQVRCAHGILPVPAPATARILQGVPMYSDEIKGELCTPTGAALLKYFAKEFRSMPVMSVAKLGYGMGKKDFEKANCVRAYIGNSDGAGGEVAELVCNLDDMTPEAVAFAQQLLLQEGALDVYTAPVVMKKGRSGLIFTCMCNIAEKDKMLSLIFKHTSTLGVREYTCRRYTLQKEQKEVQTKLGAVRVKTSNGFGIAKYKPEYEDIARIAREQNLSVQDVINKIAIDTRVFYITSK
ncbi:MAG: nickel pincer cofactor biosynthesis protein LarC [Fibromonadales bacterium]|nr:nickel pincer cofactor biosynthesis protein LarC [Fibromonadales bacterium]